MAKKASIHEDEFLGILVSKGIVSFDDSDRYTNVLLTLVSEGPDLNFEIVGESNRSDKLVVIGEQGKWYRVQPPSGISRNIFRHFCIITRLIQKNLYFVKYSILPKSYDRRIWR